MLDAALLALIKANASLKTLADAGSDDALAQLVPSLANVTFPASWSAGTVLGAVSTTDIVKVTNAGLASAIQDACVRQDVAGVLYLAQVCVDGGWITTAEQTAIATALSATTSAPDTSVGHVQVSSVLAPARLAQHAGRALPLDWTQV